MSIWLRSRNTGSSCVGSADVGEMSYTPHCSTVSDGKEDADGVNDGETTVAEAVFVGVGVLVDERDAVGVVVDERVAVSVLGETVLVGVVELVGETVGGTAAIRAGSASRRAPRAMVR